MCDNEDGTAVKRWTVRPLVFVVGYREGLPPDSSEKSKKEVLPMSDFELLMIVFTVLSLLIMAYNSRK